MQGDTPMPILELTYIEQGLLFSTGFFSVASCLVLCAAEVLSLAGKSTRSLFVDIELKS